MNVSLIPTDRSELLRPERVAQDILTINRYCNMFRAEPRSVHYRGKEDRERNGEHAHHVAFMARFVNTRARLGLDPDLLARMAECHDYVEIYAKDTPMFPDVYRGIDDQPDLSDKKEREERAYVRLKEELSGIYPELIADIRAYLDQANAEAVFVSAFEKLLTVINIFQDDGRSWRLYCVPIQEADRRHRARASKHEAVKAWYEFVVERIWEDANQRPNFYMEQPPPGPRKRVADSV